MDLKKERATNNGALGQDFASEAIVMVPQRGGPLRVVAVVFGFAYWLTGGIY